LKGLITGTGSATTAIITGTGSVTP
jgi:hypothetical protein